MNKNILELPDAGTLGENDFLHVIQKGLDKKATFKQLPVVTENSNGLMSARDYKMFSVRTLYISINQEVNLGLLNCKLFCLSSPYAGTSALFLINYFVGSLYIAGDNVFFSEKLVDNKIFFGRKEANGDIFVINKTSRLQTIYIV